MYIFNMSHPDENDFQEVILSDDENTQTQNQQSNNQVRSRALEMRTIYSNDNLILDTQISSDVLSDYGGSMYSHNFVIILAQIQSQQSCNMYVYL